MRLALALALLLALPATASASKVSVVLADGCQGDVACSKYGGAPPVPITTFEGAPGEANRVGVGRAGGEFVVRDDGAVLTAESPCVAVDAHSARCPVTEGSYGLPGFARLLGDGDDRSRSRATCAWQTELAGGDGKDVIEGGDEDDAIDGGPGDDRLLGGGGHDELSYATRTAPVVVDLARETGGEAGEDDGVGGFEVLVGGRGDDVLRGAAGDEMIDGGAGDDVLRGRGGDDALFGGTGADRLSGQAGDDRLYGDPAQGDDYYTPIIRLLPDRLDGGARRRRARRHRRAQHLPRRAGRRRARGRRRAGPDGRRPGPRPRARPRRRARPRALRRGRDRPRPTAATRAAAASAAAPAPAAAIRASTCASRARAWSRGRRPPSIRPSSSRHGGPRPRHDRRPRGRSSVRPR